VKALFAFASVLVIVSGLPKALAEPVRCANGKETIYQNAPCPAGYVASVVSSSLSVVSPEKPIVDHEEDKRGMVASRKTRVKTPRNPANVREFRSLFPCPSTLEETGPCPGWVVDHKIPLACGGVDDYSNMQWQKKAEAKAKDKVELLCGR